MILHADSAKYARTAQSARILRPESEVVTLRRLSLIPPRTAPTKMPIYVALCEYRWFRRAATAYI